jgi:hypothetical protein
MSRYMALMELYHGRDGIALMLAIMGTVLASGEFLIETSPLPFVRSHLPAWRNSYWTLLLLIYLGLFILVTFLWNPTI